MQVLLQPYLDGRKVMHLLYKVLRVETAKALYNDFKKATDSENAEHVYALSQHAAAQCVKDALKEEPHTDSKAMVRRPHKEAVSGHCLAVKVLARTSTKSWG